MRSKGFTLIELLIGMSILSMLLITANYSYSILANRWDKGLGDFNDTMQFSKNIYVLDRLIKGVQPYVIKDETGKSAIFFVGGKQSLLGVSLNSIRYPGRAEFFRLSAIQNESRTYDVIYQSVPFDHRIINEANQEIEFQYKAILFSNVKDVSFRYYGWKHIYDKTDNDGSKEANWFDIYSGVKSRYFPSQIIFKLLTENGEITLSARLQSSPENWIALFKDHDD